MTILAGRGVARESIAAGDDVPDRSPPVLRPTAPPLWNKRLRPGGLAKVRTATRTAFRSALLVGGAFATFPGFLVAMAPGLDPSWILAINESAARGWKFGSDVVFTYGPLGFVLFPLDLGNNFVHSVFWRSLIWAIWWLSIALVVRRFEGTLAPLLFVLVSVSSNLRDELAGVALLAVANLLVVSHCDRKPPWAALAMPVAAFTLLAKFNIGLAAAGALAVWMAGEWLQGADRRLRAAIGVAGLYGALVAGLFALRGNPLMSLPRFVSDSLLLMSCFSSQMPAEGAPREIVLYFGMIAVVLIALSASRRPFARHGFVFALVAFPLFVLFKSGFVRQDGHERDAFVTGVPLLALTLLGARRRAERGALAAAVAALLGAELYYQDAKFGWFTLRPAGFGHLSDLRDFGSFRRRMHDISAAVAASLALPPGWRERIGSSETDAWPASLSKLWANDLRRRPRYIFQGYQVHHPRLDRACAERYRGADAPRWVLFEHQAIDFEHPALVDSTTFLELLRWYGLAERSGEMLLLERRPIPRFGRQIGLERRTLRFGERWELPSADGALVVLEADLSLSLRGRVEAALWKVSPPKLRVEYVDGRWQDYGVVWRNLTAGFLASDLPRDLDGDARLFAGGRGDPVRALCFVGDARRFRDEIPIRCWRLEASGSP